jgi:hypothetical protein
MSDPLGFFMFTALALFAIGLGTFALRTGEYRRAGVTRQDHPREFWVRAIFQLGLGTAFAVTALTKLFDRGPRPAPRSPNACDGYASSFDCFMGESFQAVVLALFAVGTPAAYAFWRWYQRRALDQITAAADNAPDDHPRRDSAA